MAETRNPVSGLTAQAVPGLGSRQPGPSGKDAPACALNVIVFAMVCGEPKVSLLRWPRLCRAVGVLLLACLIIGATAAPAHANDAGDCSQTNDNERAIGACTARIQTLKSLQKGMVTGWIAGGYFGDRAIADAYNNRGAAYLRKGSYREATLDFNAALSIVPDNALFYFNRGAAFGAAGDFKGAIVDFDHSLSLQPDFPEALYSRALARLKSGNADLALADSERAVHLMPRNARALAVRADVYAALGRIEEAVVDYRAALSVDPTMRAAADAIRKLGFQP